MIALWTDLYLTMTSVGTILYTSDSQECIEQYFDFINSSVIQAIDRAKDALKHGFLCPSIVSAADRITLKAGVIQLVPTEAAGVSLYALTSFYPVFQKVHPSCLHYN